MFDDSSSRTYFPVLGQGDTRARTVDLRIRLQVLVKCTGLFVSETHFNVPFPKYVITPMTTRFCLHHTNVIGVQEEKLMKKCCTCNKWIYYILSV